MYLPLRPPLEEKNMRAEKLAYILVTLLWFGIQVMQWI